MRSVGLEVVFVVFFFGFSIAGYGVVLTFSFWVSGEGGGFEGRVYVERVSEELGFYLLVIFAFRGG